MTRRPTDRPLPTPRLLVGTPYALRAPADWAHAGEVTAPDAEDVAWQASHHLPCPAWLWVQGPDGKTTGILVTPQGAGRVGR